MNNNIKELNKLHKMSWESLNPGSGLLCCVTVIPDHEGYGIITLYGKYVYDIFPKCKKAIFCKKVSLSKLVSALEQLVGIYTEINGIEDGNWIIDKKYSSWKEFDNLSEDDIIIDVQVCKLLAMVKSFIWNNRTSKDVIGYFAYDYESDYTFGMDFGTEGGTPLSDVSKEVKLLLGEVE